MATNSQFQIILSFKAVMDGLNTYVNAYKTRMEEVAAFNRKIMNGGAAIQQAIGQLGAVLGGAALIKYAKDAAEADKIQQQLLRTLERVKESGAAEALNAQATALQRVTHFSDEAVTTVQRLLINAGLSAQQTQDLTEQVLDFAQETGQAAESAAALIARTLRGQTDELGRYNIKLDTSKGKVDALREALANYASGAARGAVADAVARENSARFADATENLGRALNRVLVPVMEQLVPLIEQTATLMTSLANILAPIAPIVGGWARNTLLVVGALGILKFAMAGMMQLINPLRAGFVLLAGESLLALNNRLAVVTARFGLMTTASVLLNDSVTTLAGAGRALAVAAGIVGAAFAGWQLGTLINEIEVGGLKIKDWAAIVLVYVQDRIGGAFSSLQTVWARTRSAWDTFRLYVQGTVLEMAITIADAWNKLPFSKKIDVGPWRAAAADVAAEVGGLDAKLQARLTEINAARALQLKDNLELMGFLKQGGGSPAFGPGAGGKPGPAPKPGAGRKDLNSESFGVDQAEQFQLQTQLLQAQLAGNQAEADRITDLLEEKKLKQELLQLEEKAGPLVAARIAALVAGRNKDRATTAEELAFQRQMGEFEIQRADIEADRLLTELEKQAQVNELLAAQNRLIDEKLAKDELQLARGVTDQEKTRLLQEISALRKQLAENQRTQESTRVLTFGEGLEQGRTSFLSTLATSAQNAADAIQGTLNGALQSTSDLLYNIGSGAMNFKEAWSTALLNVGQNFLRMTTDMVAKMIWRATVERGLNALMVALHIGGEATKTAASTAGSAKRLAMVVKEALADVYHGAVAAFKSMASIPYVGPILGAAALAGALALGLGLVGKIGGHAKGGIVAGGRQLSWLNEEGTEAVIRAPMVQRFGESFFSQLNNGVLDLGALPGNVARQMPAAAEVSRAGRGGTAQGAAVPERPGRSILVVPDMVSARRMARDPEFENVIVDVMRRRRGDILEG